MDRELLGSEQRLVIDTFQKSFDSQKNCQIVLYGIGKNTEAVLYGTEGFQFVGLMDQAATGQMVYGQKVLSDAEVIAIHPMIIIIARQSVVNIIYKRIQYLSLEYGIPIYDFQGNMLGQTSLAYGNESLPYWDVSEQDLIKRIDENEIISFDIFDTLLMRKVLIPTDVFDIVEIRLKEQGYEYPFADMRLRAEQELEYPDIDDIYKKMQELYDLNSTLIERMKELECTVDISLLMRREKMCQIFDMAVAKGKQVYLLSDMYYPSNYLQRLLQQNRISGYKGLFVSCDVKKEKSDGALYQYFLEYVGVGRSLHIGDNRRVDIEMARKNGLDAYQIYSAYELLMASAMQDILSDVNTLQKRCIVGLIISRIFNNPFALYGSKGYFRINDIGDVGYCFVAPMLNEFTDWFISQVKENRIQQVLFPSRDGYLVKKIYEMKADCNAETVYFRASRRAVTVAGIYDKSDIEKIASRRYNGRYADYLRSRFGIDMSPIDERRDNVIGSVQDSEVQQLLADYEDKILQNAKVERIQYLKYLSTMGILTDKRQALFDCVAGGTIQYYLTKLLQQNLLGIYFATVNLPNDMYAANTASIRTAYGNMESYTVHNQFEKYYLFLEAVLVDSMPTFSHISFDGDELYEQESGRNNYDEIEKLQKAVLEYVADYEELFPRGYHENLRGFVDMLFGIPFSDRCIVEERIREVFQNDDIYDGIQAYPLWGN